MITVTAILFVLGLAFGSFINALVWRLHQQQKTSPPAGGKSQKYSIIHGRSMCVHCKRKLATKDLIPLFSWLILQGKCRYCHKPISWQYPVVELGAAILFAGSYLFWPLDLTVTANKINFIVWLIALVGLIALFVYDVRWRLLPNRIVFPLIMLAAAGALAEAAAAGSMEPIISSIFGLLAGGGIFYLLFQISSGQWIGGGDVKLGFALGILVGGPWPALLLIFLASILGSVFSLPLMVSNRLKAKSRIAFGPFLIISAIIIRLVGDSIIEWYANLIYF